MSLEVVGVHPQGKVFAKRSSSVNKAQYFVTCSDLITSVVHHFSLSSGGGTRGAAGEPPNGKMELRPAVKIV